VNESTATLKTADGLDLYVRRWQADDVAHRWTFVVVHGLGEHGGRYQHLAEWFAPLGATGLRDGPARPWAEAVAREDTRRASTPCSTTSTPP